MIVWASSWAFLFLIPLLVLSFLFFVKRKRNRPSFRFSNVSFFSGLDLGVKTKLVYLPVVLIFVSLFLSILSLARPQVINQKQKKNVEGIDIILALDTSISMLIEDMEPKNRLESSKKIISEFIDKRVSDRIGLIVFSGESYTRVPLTLDYSILKSSLASVQTSKNIKTGTAIGVALANSVARLKDSTAKSRVVIFLTDGESNRGLISPETAIDIAKGFGIKVYSIGMGFDGQARVPVDVQLPSGLFRKSYRALRSKVNVKLLKKMADETGGSFFRATTTEALKHIFEKIDKLEKSKIEFGTLVSHQEIFKDFLKWSIGLYFLALLLELKVFRRLP